MDETIKAHTYPGIKEKALIETYDKFVKDRDGSEMRGKIVIKNKS